MALSIVMLAPAALAVPIPRIDLPDLLGTNNFLIRVLNESTRCNGCRVGNVEATAADPDGTVAQFVWPLELPLGA